MSEVIHPAHYNKGRYETIDVIEDIVQFYSDPVAAFLAGQVIKYLSRAPHKGRYEQDLKKAAYYMDRLADMSSANAYPVCPDSVKHTECRGCLYEDLPGTDMPCSVCCGTQIPGTEAYAARKDYYHE